MIIWPDRRSYLLHHARAVGQRPIASLIWHEVQTSRSNALRRRRQTARPLRINAIAGQEAFPGKITSGCMHSRDVCARCVERTIDLEVNGKGNASRIMCPQVGCDEELSYEDVRRQASGDVFVRFDKHLLDAALRAEPNFRWCAHNGCGNGQILVGSVGKNVFFFCHGCGRRTCAHHRCAWHAGRSCAQYDLDGQNCEEVALLQYLEQQGSTVRCPKCHHGIEKSGGCDHMTCHRNVGGCGAEFCYRCGADYNGPSGIFSVGNHAHATTCVHYRPLS
eukprot:TRINITY_DN36476_c0_g1_i1.p1 TRINITY_DN36476_c0_g1~~TRINITY_DN36476_c0_g1_i1.p1  ORF type:complete len:277 (-),score=21.30 TRINITY_DN36476_c0_g1_i1:47-877(-)